MSVGEYNARLAQFKAGLIWPSVVSPDDLIATMNEKPELVLQRTDVYAVAPSMLGFGYDPSGPWKDERLRQAVSMLIDRDTFVSLRSNHDALEANGLPAEPRYHSTVGAGWEGYWVDPRDSRFGAEAKYYTYDPAAASQLISAAGFAEGFDTLLHYSGGMDYSPSYTRNVEMISGMLYEGGVRAKLDPRSHADDWLPNYQSGYTQSANVGRAMPGFPGLVLRPAAAYPTPQSQLYSMYNRFGSQFHGMTPNGQSPQLGDPEVNNALDSLRKEGNLGRQQELSLGFARMMARKAYDIPVLPFAPTHYSLSWPVIGNLGVYRGWPGGSANAETNIHLWVDQGQAPITIPNP
jgi:ABC-type transport system substrate-binding protein